VEYDSDPLDLALIQSLAVGERVETFARVADAILAVTDRRLLVSRRDRMVLDVHFAALRRVQYDIERERPATLVLVPEEPQQEPQVLPVPPDAYADVARVLVVVGQRLATSA
jgi:hypothetical protein